MVRKLDSAMRGVDGACKHDSAMHGVHGAQARFGDARGGWCASTIRRCDSACKHDSAMRGVDGVPARFGDARGGCGAPDRVTDVSRTLFCGNSSRLLVVDIASVAVCPNDIAGQVIPYLTTSH